MDKRTMTIEQYYGVKSEHISALCGKCGGVLVETMPSYFYTTTAYKKHFCPHCKDYPVSITYIYKSI